MCKITKCFQPVLVPMVASEVNMERLLEPTVPEPIHQTAAIHTQKEDTEVHMMLY